MSVRKTNELYCSSSQRLIDPWTPVRKAPIRVTFLSALSAATPEARPTSAPACQGS